MLTVDEIRRINLRALTSRKGGTADLARKMSQLEGYEKPVSESQLSQWVLGSPDSKTKRPRGMRPESCRRAEKAAGVPPGWLDAQHTPEELAAVAGAAVVPSAAPTPPAGRESQALALALEFANLPERTHDGRSKEDLLAWLHGVIGAWEHHDPRPRVAAPSPAPAPAPEKQHGKARAPRAARSA